MTKKTVATTGYNYNIIIHIFFFFSKYNTHYTSNYSNVYHFLSIYFLSSNVEKYFKIVSLWKHFKGNVY